MIAVPGSLIGTFAVLRCWLLRMNNLSMSRPGVAIGIVGD